MLWIYTYIYIHTIIWLIIKVFKNKFVKISKENYTKYFVKTLHLDASMLVLTPV